MRRGRRPDGPWSASRRPHPRPRPGAGRGATSRRGTALERGSTLHLPAISPFASPPLPSPRRGGVGGGVTIVLTAQTRYAARRRRGFGVVVASSQRVVWRVLALLLRPLPAMRVSR